MDPLLNPGPGHVAGNSASNESATSAVSWAAIIAGAFVAASATVLLVALGAGLGFATLSPWPHSRASATTFTAATAIWFIVTQWISSGAGGYITGRLRTRWVGTHTHEVFFRDTAHGFVTWAVATVIGALILANAASSMAGAGVGAAQRGVAQAQNGSVVSPYDVDTLFRSTTPDASSSVSDARAETTRILEKGLPSGDVSAADRSYVSQLIAARSGISQSDAQKRVDDVVAQLLVAQTKAQQATDAARKAAAAAAICTALSMLIGAFIACVAAALGGHERDEHA